MNKCSGVSSIADFFTAIRRCRAHLVVVRMTTGLLCEKYRHIKPAQPAESSGAMADGAAPPQETQKSPAAGTLRRFSDVSRASLIMMCAVHHLVTQEAATGGHFRSPNTYSTKVATCSASKSGSKALVSSPTSASSATATGLVFQRK